MDSDGIIFLLALGPVGAVGFYWAMHRYYRNTDKSHAFEHETAVEVLALTGSEADRKVDELREVRSTQIAGANAGNHRQRVQPM